MGAGHGTSCICKMPVPVALYLAHCTLCWAAQWCRTPGRTPWAWVRQLPGINHPLGQFCTVSGDLLLHPLRAKSPSAGGKKPGPGGAVWEKTVYLVFNPAEVQAEDSIDAEKQINVIPILGCDGSEDQALLGTTCWELGVHLGHLGQRQWWRGSSSPSCSLQIIKSQKTIAQSSLAILLCAGKCHEAPGALAGCLWYDQQRGLMSNLGNLLFQGPRVTKERKPISTRVAQGGLVLEN